MLDRQIKSWSLVSAMLTSMVVAVYLVSVAFDPLKGYADADIQDKINIFSMMAGSTILALGLVASVYRSFAKCVILSYRPGWLRPVPMAMTILLRICAAFMMNQLVPWLISHSQLGSTYIGVPLVVAAVCAVVSFADKGAILILMSNLPTPTPAPSPKSLMSWAPSNRGGEPEPLLDQPDSIK